MVKWVHSSCKIIVNTCNLFNISATGIRCVNDANYIAFRISTKASYFIQNQVYSRYMTWEDMHGYISAPYISVYVHFPKKAEKLSTIHP
jgi:hypothetical protein